VAIANQPVRRFLCFVLNTIAVAVFGEESGSLNDFRATSCATAQESGAMDYNCHSWFE
jgi:hypothetical protein